MSIGLLALLDDISVLADDTATMTKISMQKTVGILGDDLAVNAKQASGYESSREIPVLIKITKGALINKVIILPFAFLLTAFASGVIPIILIFGGAYLAFEGSEKIIEFLIIKFSNKNKHKKNSLQISMNEDEKVKSAIFTDFILSIEIVLIALSAVLKQPLLTQIITVIFVSILATFFVYGIVALIVRLDDIGFFLQKKSKKTIGKKIGQILVLSLPFIIKALSVIGTLAMLLVAGGLFRHNIDFFHHIYEQLNIFSIIFDLLLGFIVGVILVLIFLLFKKIKI